MAIIPVPVEQAVGTDIDDTMYNTLVKAARMGIGRPAACYYPTTSANLSVGNAAWQVVPLDAKYYDRDPVGGVVSWSSAHPTRLVSNYTGLIRAEAHVVFPTTGTGTRRCMIRLGAAGNVALGSHLDEATSAVDTLGVGTRLRVFRKVEVTAGTYVELFVWQNNGSAESMIAGPVATSLEIELVSA